MALNDIQRFQPPKLYEDLELHMQSKAIVTLYRSRIDTKDFQTLVEMLGLDDALLQLRLAKIADS